MSHLGVQGSASFTFDDEGRFVSMTAKRYMGAGPDATLERWVIPATAWRRLDGVVVPVKGDVIWALEAGDFSYYRWEITELQYDQPKLY